MHNHDVKREKRFQIRLIEKQFSSRFICSPCLFPLCGVTCPPLDPRTALSIRIHLQDVPGCMCVNHCWHDLLILFIPSVNSCLHTTENYHSSTSSLILWLNCTTFQKLLLFHKPMKTWWQKMAGGEEQSDNCVKYQTGQNKTVSVPAVDHPSV